MAHPDSHFSFDAQSALVVVDVQNDFASPRGGLYVRDGEQIVSLINELIAEARRAGAGVVYTQDWHPESTPHFAKDGGIWPVHCVRNTWGAELVSELAVAGPVVQKGTGGEDGYSGFAVRDPETGAEAPTALERLLRDRGSQRVLIVGLARDVCVKETALDARRLGFETYVYADATRSVNLRPGDGARAVAQMVQAGAHIV
jgi:nicotinamidase/pyrazinamidase